MSSLPSLTTPSISTSRHMGLALLMLATTLVAYAQGPGPAGKGPMTPGAMQKIHEMRVERLAKRINATPEQKQKLLIIQQRDNVKLLEIETKRQMLRKRETELMRAEKFDRAAMERIQKEHRVLQDEHEAIREKQRLDGIEILTPLQRTKLGAHDHSMMGQINKKSLDKKTPRSIHSVRGGSELDIMLGGEGIPEKLRMHKFKLRAVQQSFFNLDCPVSGHPADAGFRAEPRW